VSRYDDIMTWIFERKYRRGASEVAFDREDLVAASEALGIPRPKNLGDVVYTYRYRKALPDTIRERAEPPAGWILVPRGTARYALVIHPQGGFIEPPEGLSETLIPDATPEIVSENELSDEQALLARVRYNRLVDIFTGVTSYSLQNHYRTSLPDIGQVELDAIYVGVDTQGRQFFMPIEAKGPRDRLSVVQIGQSIACWQEKFRSLICRPLAACGSADGSITMFEFDVTDRWEQIGYREVRRYRLVPASEVPAGQRNPFKTGAP